MGNNPESHKEKVIDLGLERLKRKLDPDFTLAGPQITGELDYPFAPIKRIRQRSTVSHAGMFFPREKGRKSTLKIIK